MNNPNPFIPQGSLVEQMNKKRARVKMAVLAVFSGTILLIAPVLLIQGCKRDQSAQQDNQDTTTPVADTNLAPTADTAALTASSNAAPAPNATAPGTAANTAPNAGANNMANTAQPPAMAPVAQPVSEPAPSSTVYVVVAHDTLAGIAKKYSVKLKDLMAANPDVTPTKLSVGHKLNIPASSSGSASASTMAASSTDSSSGGSDVYTVKSGDNLTKIAHNSGTTVKELMALNNMTTTRINAGQKLKLPAKTAAASPMESVPAATTTASNPTSSTSAMR
jgi:LysM repeat protein